MSKVPLAVLIVFLLAFTIWLENVQAQNVPEWVKNTAKWYGEGLISETEFLNAIKFLIENSIIILDSKIELDEESSELTATVIIPNENSKQTNLGFYIPLNLEIKRGTTVQWINEDNFAHTVQSQDEFGKATSLFSSSILQTGEIFSHTFDDAGTYNYFCTFHPWRVGVVTVR